MRLNPNTLHYWHSGGSVHGATAAGTAVAIRAPLALYLSLVRAAALQEPGPGRDYLDRCVAQLGQAIKDMGRWTACAVAA